MTASSIISAAGVTKSFSLGARRIDAVRGIDLEIETPGFYAIMGPSGSGKSTLLHLLAGLDTVDDGSITVAGAALEALSERELTAFRRRRIGLVFQRFNLIPTLTALENVALPAMLDGMARDEREARAAELLEQLGLGDRMTHRPDALSGGEQQRVAIARSLVFEPQVLFADEPSGNLDSEASAALWALIRELTEGTARTVVMVTHEPDAALHTRHIFLLRDGVIHDSFDTEGLDAASLATRMQHAGR